jgi:Na+-translocating ferredoxin:NAD+ oxidoreductase RnfG subunit
MRSRRASASCSDAAASARLLALAAGLLVLLAAPASATVFHSRQEALELAFPAADRIAKQTFILDEAQVEAVEAASRSKLESKLVTLWTAFRGDERLGTAHVDVHVVRTHPEAVLVVLTPEGVVRSVRVIAFHEPLDYLPAARWYEQLAGRTRGDALRVGGDVHAVVGATLSAHAAVDSVRRALAYHALLIERTP